MEEDNKALVRRRFAEFDRGNFDVFDELFAPDYVFHVPGTEEPLNRTEIRDFYRALYAAIPDLRHTLIDQIADGDKVVTRWTASGTHSGAPLFGVAKSRKRLTLRGINIYRILGGLLAESHVSWDMLGLHQQLGNISGFPARSFAAIGTWPTPESRGSRATTAGRKAAKTRKRRAAAKKAARTRKRKAAGRKAALTRKRKRGS